MKDKKLIGAGVVTAIASSLCCITPVLALLSGTTGMASTFAWLEPFRPYLIGFTVLVLGFAWYQKLQATAAIDCNCEVEEKPSFWQSKSFLGVVTVFTIVMTAFPYYSSAFYPEPEKQTLSFNTDNIQTIELGIEGMTCTGCEEHVNHAVYQLGGVVKVESSYENENVEIQFDPSKTNLEAIEAAIKTTGYAVIK